MNRTEIAAEIAADLASNSTGAIRATHLRSVLTELLNASRLPEDVGCLRPVTVYAASNITLSGTQTIDGRALVAGDSVLCGGQSTGSQNGVWVVAAGAWARRGDADAAGELTCGILVPIAEGSTYGGKLYRLTTTGTITPGTTSLSFAVAALSSVGMSDLPAAAKAVSFQFVIDGGGSAITTGQKGHLVIPVAMTITEVQLLADQSGSAVVDIWKDTYANFPPSGADSITASAKPTISSATKAKDSTLTGWTTSVAAGDILAFNVDSAATITRLTLVLIGTKS